MISEIQKNGIKKNDNIDDIYEAFRVGWQWYFTCYKTTIRYKK